MLSFAHREMSFLCGNYLSATVTRIIVKVSEDILVDFRKYQIFIDIFNVSSIFEASFLLIKLLGCSTTQLVIAKRYILGATASVSKYHCQTPFIKKNNFRIIDFSNLISRIDASSCGLYSQAFAQINECGNCMNKIIS
jgi:hypothetical protein